MAANPMPEFQRLTRERNEIISRNRSRRLTGAPLLPVPEKPVQPLRVQILTPDGEYVGTWPYGVTKEQALEDCLEHGHTKTPQN
jgi:hypothetical protein